jgi:hypothetical protein
MATSDEVLDGAILAAVRPSCPRHRHVLFGLGKPS